MTHNPSGPPPIRLTPRELAHEHVSNCADGNYIGCYWFAEKPDEFPHSDECDRLTAAITADREATRREAIELAAAAQAARVCLSETSSHHGTAVRGCTKCERARHALSAVDKALNRLAHEQAVDGGSETPLSELCWCGSSAEFTHVHLHSVVVPQTPSPHATSLRLGSEVDDLRAQLATLRSERDALRGLLVAVVKQWHDDYHCCFTGNEPGHAQGCPLDAAEKFLAARNDAEGTP